jgi:hypothetical protein
LSCPLARFLGFGFAIARRASGFERRQQTAGGIGDFVDRAIKCILVDARGVREAGKLAYELYRGGADFLLRGRRLEVKQRANVAAHG